MPPFLCRFLARKANGTRPMSVREIAKASGLPKTKVAGISLRASWEGVPVDEMEKFSLACGIQLLNCWAQRDFLRRRKKVLLQHATITQRRYFARLLSLRKAA